MSPGQFADTQYQQVYKPKIFLVAKVTAAAPGRTIGLGLENHVGPQNGGGWVARSPDQCWDVFGNRLVARTVTNSGFRSQKKARAVQLMTGGKKTFQKLGEGVENSIATNEPSGLNCGGRAT